MLSILGIRPLVVPAFTAILLAFTLPTGISAVAKGDDWAAVVDRSSHRASSFDRSGGNEDNVVNLEPGKAIVMLDTDGPGKITHFWFTVSTFQDHQFALRDLVLRITWENAKVASIEVPLGDFFGLGHGKRYQVHSLPISVGSNERALNCYWPMPFYTHARLELVNNGTRSLRRVYYNLDYELGPLPPHQGLFHAEFRRVKDLPPQSLVGNTTGKDNYVILDALGEGQYVGCFLFVDSAPGGWWGEGDDMMFIDGEETPSINGTGTEDYFCDAWGFKTTFSYPCYGVPFLEKQPDGWKQTSAYRFHLPDPVRFKKSLRVTIEHGWGGKAKYDYSSVAYWYQLEPNACRNALPKGPDYQPRAHLSKAPAVPTSQTISATLAESVLRQRGIAARAVTTEAAKAFTEGIEGGKSLSGGILRIDSPGKPVEIPISVPAPSKYHVVVKLYNIGQTAPVTFGFKGCPAKTLEKIEKNRSGIDLGEIEVGEDRTIVITAESSASFAIDSFQVEVQK